MYRVWFFKYNSFHSFTLLFLQINTNVCDSFSFFFTQELWRIKPVCELPFFPHLKKEKKKCWKWLLKEFAVALKWCRNISTTSLFLDKLIRKLHILLIMSSSRAGAELLLLAYVLFVADLALQSPCGLCPDCDKSLQIFFIVTSVDQVYFYCQHWPHLRGPQDPMRHNSTSDLQCFSELCNS